jgi:hypothetical protein
MSSPSVDSVRRWLALHRRPVAAACTFISVLLALAALTGQAEPSTEAGSDAETGTSDTVPAGQLAVPLRLGDAAIASLLGPGDRVDVIATDGRAGATVVASGVTVNAVPSGDDGVWGDDDGLVVVLATPEQAVSLAAAAGAHLTIAVHPG